LFRQIFQEIAADSVFFGKTLLTKSFSIDFCIEDRSMDCESNTCPRAVPGAVPENVTRAAEQLACLLTDTAVFQNFVRLARAARLDVEVSTLMERIQESTYAPMAAVAGSHEGPDQVDLENQLEMLPIVLEYRKAEEAIRELFQAVDREVSAAVGVAFAENGKPSACG
jgi:cell fate (sporulation/competence/biofilm development) regulator YmcA (YheA/YmcA/DUF963 family)